MLAHRPSTAAVNTGGIDPVAPGSAVLHMQQMCAHQSTK